MTTAAKSLPAHGERPRYLRGCRCQPCIGANKRYCKQYRVRTINKPVRIDATPVRELLQEWVDQGYSQTQIGDAVGKKSGDISKLLHGQPTIAPSVAERILRSPGPDGTPAHARVDSTATIRRGRALHAIGYPIYVIAENVPMATNHLGRVLYHQPAAVSAAVAHGMRDLYKQWSGTPGPSHFAIHNARRRSWDGPLAWDDDTIGDPQAHPEWTGECGTDRGWWMHNINNIPACRRCDEAHSAWLAERKHLPSAERFRQLAYAKGAASNRGAVLAADARELMRVSGLNTEQVAERLGVTRNHIQQELLRHPEAADTQPADQAETELAA